MRGVIVITESMLTIGAIVAGLLLLVIVFNTVFSYEAKSVEDTALLAIARSLDLSMNRAAASASSSTLVHEFPEGIKLKVFLDPKSMEISYIDDTKSVKRAFAASMNIDRTYTFDDPEKLCIIKNRNDGKIVVSESCECNIKDEKCDAACLVYEECDPDCYKPWADNVCDPRCVEQDAICDPDCYRNQADLTIDMDCIKPDDGICDPDTHNLADGVCDNDCYTDESTVCEPDCTPVDTDSDNIEDEKDGLCYAACIDYIIEKPKSIFLESDGVCDLDCEEENDVCDPDCTKDEDCEIQCALEEESCEELGCCDNAGVCCPGDSVCRTECCGNDECETEEMWDRGNAVRWENFYTCREDCEYEEDGVCSKVLDNECDPDCLEQYDEYGGNAYCDPDCSFQIAGICPYDDSDDQTEEDDVCMEIEDNECDPDCDSRDLCDPDCCSFNTPNACPASPGCHCPTRAGTGSFTKSPWFSNTDSQDCDSHTAHWTDNVIEICSDEAISFLDMHGWDIKQVAETITSGSPEGWAFDYSRYQTIISEGVQKASKTIKANSEYEEKNSVCCCTRDCPCALCDVFDECCGVGFCGDHATALLSILRTMGVPAKDVFAAFRGGVGCGRHAFVVYKCDPELPEHLTLEECSGHENQWLQVDATWHSIQPLQESSVCNDMCVWWNDIDPYPLIDPDVYGFGGKITDYGDPYKNYGYPFPAESGCRQGVGCGFESLCNAVNVNCIA